MNISFKKIIGKKTLLCDLVYQREKNNYLLSVIDEKTQEIELTKVFNSILDAINWIEELEK